MPGPIAAAAGGILIEKAADEDSIVNTAFKFTLLIGLAIAIGLGIFLIFKLTSFLDDPLGSISASSFGWVGPVTPSGILVNAFLSSTIFGRAFKRVALK